MFIRYKKNAGTLEAVAKVYSQQEHGIDPHLVDGDAIRVIERLEERGYESYLVGGAVRDLMLGRRPKDFDVVTAASPRAVHRIFRNSMIVGRRFKIVHVVFGKKIIEVSTFRSLDEHEANNDNTFGTIEEDCQRRDYSINSLYYDPINETIIDFNNSMEDIKNKRLVSLIPLNKSFIEDPVRMIRGVKYSVTTGFKMSLRLKLAIRHYAPELQYVSTSRMTEEVNKILGSGNSSEIFAALHHFGLLPYILPCISVFGKYQQFYDSLNTLDDKINEISSDAKRRTFPKAMMYLALVHPFIADNKDITDPKELFKDTLRQVRVLLSPITPPKFELESTAVMHLRLNGKYAPKGNSNSALKRSNAKASTGSKSTTKSTTKNTANNVVKSTNKPRRRKKKATTPTPGSSTNATASLAAAVTTSATE